MFGSKKIIIGVLGLMSVQASAEAASGPTGVIGRMRAKTQKLVERGVHMWKVDRHLLPSSAKPEAHGAEGQPLWLLGNADQAKSGAKKTLVFFHGAGQPTNNIIIHRLASALKAEKIDMNVVSMPYSDGGKSFQNLVQTMPDASIVLAAHSAGGAPQMTAINDPGVRAKIHAAVGINTVTTLSDSEVPLLRIAGKWDGGSYLMGDIANRPRKNVVVQMPLSDHSMRYRTPEQNDKEHHDYTVATFEMNRQVAKEIARLIEAPAAFVAGANAKWFQTEQSRLTSQVQGLEQQLKATNAAHKKELQAALALAAQKSHKVGPAPSEADKAKPRALAAKRTSPREE